jgi:hypothetical protein
LQHPPGATRRRVGSIGFGAGPANYDRPTVTLLDVHEGWAWFVIIGNGLAGLWALAAVRLEALRLRALWWFTVIAQLSIFVQVALGVGLVAGQDREAPQFHMFYGFVAIIAVAIIYSYRYQVGTVRHEPDPDDDDDPDAGVLVTQDPKWRYLLYGLGGLFLMGLGIRAMLVG